MAFVLKDRVRESSTSTGTGDFTLAGATSGYQSFGSAMSVGDTCWYTIVLAGSQWETGVGTYSASNTLTRTTVHESSNSNALVTFSAGTKDVFIGQLASTAADNVGKIEFWPTSELKTRRLKTNGASVSRSTYADLTAYLVKSKTVTFTNGSANIGCTAHGFSVGDPVKLFTSSALPTNFTAGTHGLVTSGTVYYVIATGLTADIFQVSATFGGSAVTAGSAGSGTQTAVVAPHGDGDGSTTFTLPEMRGEHLRVWDDGRAVDTSRLIGSAQLDAFQGHNHTVTGTCSGSTTTGAQLWIGSGSGAQPGAGSSNPASFGDATFSGTISGSATTISTNGSNGTPRTASETRGRNVALLATIRY